MLHTKPIARPTQYASCADFQRIFEEEMNSLYLLSFLLTADRQKAEQCFVSGLEDAVEGNPVFKQWARSWARRKIVENAVRLINPKPAYGNGEQTSGTVNDSEMSSVEQRAIDAVLNLPTFQRFVYVMSVLERYSDQDCCVILGCSRREILSARSSAFQQLGNSMEFQQLVNANAEKKASPEFSSSAVAWLLSPHLAI